MTEQELSALSKTQYSIEEAKELVYQYDLPFLIEQEIYPHHKRSADHAWKLGKLHREWNDLINEYNLIVIQAPRDHLKTFFFSEMTALRYAKQHPESSVRIFSKSDPLAISILDNIKRRWATKPYFKDLLDGADINNKTEIVLGNGSRIKACGFWSSARGGHDDLMIFDDVIDMAVIYSDEQNRKSKERLAAEILPMAEPHTQLIFVGTKQRDDDIYNVNWGEILEDESRKSVSRVYDAIVDEEKQITLYPEKWSWAALMQKKAQISELAGVKFFDKEYRNLATNLVGEIIKPEWKREYEHLPMSKNEKGEMIMKKLEIYSGWDLSVGRRPDDPKSDMTAKVSLAYDYDTRDIYILSYYEARIDFPNRLRAVSEAAEIERPVKIAIEDNVFQTDTVQVAKATIPTPIVGVTTLKNKVEKYQMELAPLVENGKIHFKKGDAMQQKLWEQLCSLPRGAHDDGADALCNALKLLPLARKASDFLTVLKR